MQAQQALRLRTHFKGAGCNTTIGCEVLLCQRALGCSQKGLPGIHIGCAVCTCAGLVGAAVVSIEAVSYIFYTTGLAHSLFAVTAFQPASAKCHFVDSSLRAATSYCMQSLAADCCHRNCTCNTSAHLTILCIHLVIFSILHLLLFVLGKPLAKILCTEVHGKHCML